MSDDPSDSPALADADSDSLDDYLQHVRRTPLLTGERERELAERMRAGDQQAHRQLVEANQRLVIVTVKRFAGRGVPVIDLVQEGNLGLLEALEHFTPDHCFRLNSYAPHFIRRRVLDMVDAQHEQRAAEQDWASDRTSPPDEQDDSASANTATPSLSTADTSAPG